MTYQDKNIAEILDMTIEAGAQFFGGRSGIADRRADTKPRSNVVCATKGAKDAKK